MNESLDNKIYSPLMKTISQLEKQTKTQSLASQESHALKLMRELAESPRWASIAFQESPALKSIRGLTESTRWASLAFQESPALKLMRELAESPRWASLAFQESPAIQAMRQLSELSSFKALQYLDNSPFPHLALNLVGEEKLASGDSNFIDEYLSEIESELADELTVCTDFNALSDKAKVALLNIYHKYLLPIVLSCCATIIMNNVDTTRNEFESVSTPSEVKALVRNSTGRFDRRLLKGYRVITNDNLNLREEPNMKSIVTTRLPIGTLVEVIDKSNRSWLLVEVEINDEFERGWISRRHTVYFK